jgi:NADPH:quinone reductase-like Zn-dependent oxidoreductase
VQPIRLALNCVGGETTKQMLKLLGSSAHLVSYGAMSKQPVSIPTSYFIFKNLVAHGFWQHKWYDDHSREDRVKLLEKLTDIITSGNAGLAILAVRTWLIFFPPAAQRAHPRNRHNQQR